MKSGVRIGKSVVGSQTTTLLFAYMGSYLTIMMVYMAQGTPLMNILNSKSIAAETLHTFVGCIGLVMVSPLTSLISGFMFDRRRKKYIIFTNNRILNIMNLVIRFVLKINYSLAMKRGILMEVLMIYILVGIVVSRIAIFIGSKIFHFLGIFTFLKDYFINKFR